MFQPVYSSAPIAFVSEDQSIIGSTASSLDGSDEAVFAFSGSGRKDAFDSFFGTGIDVRGSIDGRFGFGVDYGLSGFEVDASVDTEASATFPERFTAELGETIIVAVGEDLEDSAFVTDALGFTLAVDVIAELEASARVFGGVAGATGTFTTSPGFDTNFELFRFDGDGITLVDTFTLADPDDSSGLRFEVERVLAASGAGSVVVKENGVVLFGPDPSVTTNLASIGLDLSGPVITGDGSSPDFISGSSSDTLVDIDISLTGFLSFFTGIPFSIETNLSIGGQFEFKLLEATAGPTIDLVRDLSFAPELGVLLDFTAPVTIDGSDVTTWTGAWTDFPEFALTQEVTTITPTFTQIGKFDTDLDLTLGLEATFEALEARYRGLGFNVGIGPIISETASDPDLVDIDVFDSEFTLGGFNEFVGASITLVTPDSLINPGIDDGVNDAPEAFADDLTTDEDTSITVTDRDLFTNDFDIDAFDILDITAIDQSLTAGTVTLDIDTVTYDPRGAFDHLNVGDIEFDSFVYTLSDAGGLSDTATVTVEIAGVNDGPEDATSAGDLTRGAITIITSAMLNIEDPDDDAVDVVITVTGDALHGDILLNGSKLAVGSTFTQDDVNNGFIAYAHDASAPTRDGFDFSAANLADPTNLVTGSFEIKIVLPPGGVNQVGDGGANGVFGGGASDRLIGAGGNDSIVGGAGNDGVNAGDGDDSISGGLGDDHLVAGRGNDFVAGDAGDDVIFGGPGNDRLFGGDGNDVINAGPGNNEVNGGAGDDELSGGNQVDRMFGEAGDDTINGLRGDDEIFAGTGDDTVNAGFGNDSVSGDGGADRLFGGSGSDVMFGGADNDILVGGSGADQLDGGAGQDRILGQGGNDRLTGGGDRDVFVFLASGGGVDDIVDFRQGEDVLRFNGGVTFADLSISADAGALRLDLPSGDAVRLLGLASVTLDSTADFIFA